MGHAYAAPQIAGREEPFRSEIRESLKGCAQAREDLAVEMLARGLSVEMSQHNGQVLRGWIHLLLETDDGWIVIDHKSSPRPRSEWPVEAIGSYGREWVTG